MTNSYQPNYNDQLIKVSYTIVSTALLSSAITNIDSIINSEARRQSLLITNNSANDLYIGFYDNLGGNVFTSNTVGWSYKLTDSQSQSIAIGADVRIAVKSAGSSGYITIVQGI